MVDEVEFDIMDADHESRILDRFASKKLSPEVKLQNIIDWHRHKANKTVNKRKSDMHKRYADFLENILSANEE